MRESPRCLVLCALKSPKKYDRRGELSQRETSRSLRLMRRAGVGGRWNGRLLVGARNPLQQQPAGDWLVSDWTMRHIFPNNTADPPCALPSRPTGVE